MKHRCAHIYADLGMCQSRNLHAMSIYCKRHFDDLDGGNKESDLQTQRLEQIRKKIKEHEKMVKKFRKLEPTIKQIKKEVGFGL